MMQHLHNQSRASSPDRSVWVAASAGSGKTKVLTDRILNLLLIGTAPERILCLTFTKAAASEMANRLREKLGTWVVCEESLLRQHLSQLGMSSPSLDDLNRARGLFALALETPGGLKIQTIHGFCQSILKRFPLEAHLSPHFQVIDESQALSLLRRAHHEIWGDPTTDDLKEAIGLLSTTFNEQQLSDLTETLINERQKLNPDATLAHKLGLYCHSCEGRDPGNSTEKTNTSGKKKSSLRGGRETSAAIQENNLLTGSPRPLARGLAMTTDFLGTKNDYIHSFFELCPPLEGVIEALAQGSVTDIKKAEALQQISYRLQSHSVIASEAAPAVIPWLDHGIQLKTILDTAVKPRYDEFWADYTSIFLTQTGEVRKSLCTQKVATPYPHVASLLEEEALRCQSLQQTLKALHIYQLSRAIQVHGQAIIDRYEILKSQHAQLDYHDLVLKTANLLLHAGTPSWVLYKLDGGLDHILIDEAQDTSPEQWQVIETLCDEFFSGTSDPRTLFVVGDGKQSIYSFQGADPKTFTAMNRHFRSKAKLSEKNMEQVSLDVSFRSTPAILQAVDAVFANAHEGVSPTPITHHAFRDSQPGRVEVWPLVRAEASETIEPWQILTTPLEDLHPRTRLAQQLALKIKSWLTEGKSIKGRPLVPGDILILVRKRGAFVDELIRYFKQYDVPVAGLDRMRLLDQLAIKDLVAFCQIALLPEDDLTLATVLKGPLFGISEEDLFDLAHGRGKTSLWQRLNDNPRFQDTVEILNQAITRAQTLTPYQFLSWILGPLQGRKKCQSRLGDEALDPLDELLNLALSYESDHTPSLQHFIQWLKREDMELKRDLDQSQDVRIMTVHGSKGLQAPLVILPDTTQVPTSRETLLWDEGQCLWSPPQTGDVPYTATLKAQSIKLEMEEYRRLLYVAMTRAEDQLYVWGWQNGPSVPSECWYEMIKGGLISIPEIEIPSHTDDRHSRKSGDPDNNSKDPQYHISSKILVEDTNLPHQKKSSLRGGCEPDVAIQENNLLTGSPGSLARELAMTTDFLGTKKANSPNKTSFSMMNRESKQNENDSDNKTKSSEFISSVEENTTLVLSSFEKNVVASAPQQATLSRPSLPQWTHLHALTERPLSQPLAPSHLGESDFSIFTQAQDGKTLMSAMKKGRIVHKLLELLPQMAPEHRLQAASHYLDTHPLTPEQREDLITKIFGIFDNFPSLFGPHSQGEVPILGTIGGRLLSGQIDRLVVDQNQVRIIDYKTNMNPPQKFGEIPLVYINQMKAYYHTLKEIYPFHEIECSLLWTQTLRIDTIDAYYLTGLDLEAA